ncbi:MAG: hypothetical protein AB8B82_16290 [Roseovarius sp.]
MKLLKAIAIAVIAVPFGQTAVQAQSISSVQAPAEFPPASFTGRQYVDSNGCVFVRAGIDGNTSWIPRVSRDRKVICGFQPSNPGGGTSLAAQPKQAAEPVQITVADPVTQPAAAPAKPAAKPATQPVVQPAAKPVTIAKAKPAPKPAAVQQPIILAQPKRVQPTVVSVPTRTVTIAQPAPAATNVITVKPASQAVLKPAMKTVTIATAKPAAPQPKTMAPRQTACRGASAVSSQYLTATGGHAIRCGPQDGWNVSVIQGGNVRNTASNTQVVTTMQAAPVTTTYKTASTTSYSYQQPQPLKRAAAPTKVIKVTPNTRIVPKHVYQQQVAATNGVYIPKGYKAVWDDDRLNTKRAHQTFAGKAQMELRWTNTVPRRLINAANGQEVSYLYPGLQYPNTSYDQQMIAGVAYAAQPAQKATTVVRSRTRSSDGQTNGAYYSGQRSAHTTVVRAPAGGYKYSGVSQARVSTRSSQSYGATGSAAQLHNGAHDR